MVSQDIEAADLAQSQSKADEANCVRIRPAEDDEKRKRKGKGDDKAQGVTADERQGGTYSWSKRADKRQSYGTMGQGPGGQQNEGKRTDKRQSFGTIGQGPGGQQNEGKRAEKRQSDDHVVAVSLPFH